MWPMLLEHILAKDNQGKRVNPHIGPKVIPPKLFLDIVPSSSGDISRACVDSRSDILD